MRHPGAPSERELVEQIIRLRAINAELLEALEDSIAAFEAWDWLVASKALRKAEKAIAKAKGES